MLHENLMKLSFFCASDVSRANSPTEKKPDPAKRCERAKVGFNGNGFRFARLICIQMFGIERRDFSCANHANDFSRWLIVRTGLAPYLC
jgi:hypothetical protein